MIKTLQIIEDLCSGCKMCQMVCSFLNTNEYNPRKSKIKIVKIEKEFVDIPVTCCDGSSCAKVSPTGVPKCVEMCPTGALIFVELDELVKMRRELVEKRAVQPIFKVIAPWKWPLPWKAVDSARAGGTK